MSHLAGPVLPMAPSRGASAAPACLRRLLGGLRTFLLFAVLVLVWMPVGLSGQEPPDTLAPADSLALPDSLRVRGDSTVADSVEAGDTIFYNLPEIAEGTGPGWARGIWHWDHEEILASGANTLLELVAPLPGMVPLRGGDYGTPLGLSAFGLGGGAVRVFRDGIEIIPLSGGIPDLQQVGLGGVQEVRFERHLGELVFHLTSMRFDDPRPYSLVEAGTGDLDTNIFRGSFANPTALGGSVAVSLERADTRGPAGEETGNRNGAWVRYQLHRGDRAGLSLNFRRMNTETEVEDYAASTRRTDWGVRGSALLVPGLVAEAYYDRSRYEVDDPREAYVGAGGSRSQMGALMSWQRSGFFARGAYRRYGGDELPAARWEFGGGADLPRFGGASVTWQRAGWGQRSTSQTRLQGWTAPLLGFSLFASREAGSRGARTGPIGTPTAQPQDAGADPMALPAGEPGDSMEVVPPLFRIADRTATRYGAQWTWRDVTVSGAFLELEADSLLPTGLEFDAGQDALPGGTRSGWEVWGRVPVPVLDGLDLEGSLQQWGTDGEWRYLPRRIYRGAFVYHNTFLESGNLELRGRLGVRGRDPMQVHRFAEPEEGEDGGDPEEEMMRSLETVPFYQNWYALLQVRIVTVRIFIRWENAAVRRNLQDLPGRVLPATRTSYGLRWTLWN